MYNISYNIEHTIIILKSLAINYPILKENSLDLAKLLLVVVDKGQLKAAADLFSDGDAPRISEYMRAKEFKKVFSEANSVFVIYPYSQTRKSKEFLNFLNTITRIGAIEETQINVMPLVISEGIPYDCDLENFFTVYLNGTLSGIHVDGMVVVPPDDQLAVVADKINSLVLNNLSQEQKALLAAVCFLYPNIFEGSLQVKFEEMLGCAEKLVELDDDNKDTGNLGDAFIQQLYYWQEQENFCDMYQLPHLETHAIENFHQVILYQEDFLFMKESLFKKIAESLLKIFSVDAIKKALVQEGLLCPENTQTYSVKMPYYNPNREYKRERMLRFRRSKFNCVGELDFMDLCEQQ